MFVLCARALSNPRSNIVPFSTQNNKLNAHTHTSRDLYSNTPCFQRTMVLCTYWSRTPRTVPVPPKYRDMNTTRHEHYAWLETSLSLSLSDLSSLYIFACDFFRKTTQSNFNPKPVVCAREQMVNENMMHNVQQSRCSLSWDWVTDKTEFPHWLSVGCCSNLIKQRPSLFPSLP